MATINDLFLDDNGFIACKENQTSKEWDNLLTELFRDWKQLKAEVKTLEIIIEDRRLEIKSGSNQNELNNLINSK